MKEIKKVVAYCRYSSDAQRDGYSIEAQKKAIIEYCKKNKYDLLDFYVDEAKTGTNDNRDSFQKLIAESSKGLYDAVIVHKLDRFSRDRYNSVIYRKKLKDNGVKLISVLESIDDDNPEDLILLSVLEGMADYYSKNLSREVKKGMNEAARNGLSTGGVPPFGYATNKKTKKYDIVENEAVIVRKIFELFNSGEDLVDIEAYAKNNSFVTRNGKYFTKKHIRRMLLNETYIGIKTYNLYKEKKTTSCAPSEPIIVENAHEPIIDIDTWNTTQKRFNTNKNPRKGIRENGTKHQYMLSGLLVCEKCGKKYTGYTSLKRSGKRYNYYLCRGKKNTLIDKCNAPQFKKDELENYITRLLIESFTPEMIDVYANKIYKAWKSTKDPEQVEKKSIEKELSKLKSKKNKLLDLYLDGTLEKDSYLIKEKDIENQILFYEKELLHANSQQEFTFEELQLAVQLMIEDLQEDIQEEDKSAIIKMFVKKILISQDKLRIYINTPCGAYTDPSGRGDGSRTHTL